MAHVDGRPAPATISPIETDILDKPMNATIPIGLDMTEYRPAIVVTGASSGIGREIARVAALDGYPMVLVAKDELEDIASELRSRGAEVTPIPIDLQCEHAPETIARILAANKLYCDVLVNSAGFGLFGPAIEIENHHQVKLIDVNVRALVALSLAFLPGMIARRKGGILNVGSVTGYFTGPYMAAYFASKAFVNSFSAALAVEAAPAGVTVTCLVPSVVRTAFFEKLPVGKTLLMKLAPRTDPERVAKAGWLGLRSGRCIVIPRLADRLVLLLPRLLPGRFLTWIIVKLWR
jgi:short-subunit dehydrogenase